MSDDDNRQRCQRKKDRRHITQLMTKHETKYDDCVCDRQAIQTQCTNTTPPWPFLVSNHSSLFFLFEFSWFEAGLRFCPFRSFFFFASFSTVCFFIKFHVHLPLFIPFHTFFFHSLFLSVFFFHIPLSLNEILERRDVSAYSGDFKK